MPMRNAEFSLLFICDLTNKQQRKFRLRCLQQGQCRNLFQESNYAFYGLLFNIKCVFYTEKQNLGESLTKPLLFQIKNYVRMF